MTNLWEYYLLSFKIISLVLLKISKAVSNGRVIPIYFAALDTRTTQLPYQEILPMLLLRLIFPPFYILLKKEVSCKKEVKSSIFAASIV